MITLSVRLLTNCASLNDVFGPDGPLEPKPLPELLETLSPQPTSPVITAIASLKSQNRLGAYNRSIRRFWSAYERELAMPLIKGLAVEFPNQLIAQYWLDRARSAEPELTEAHLGQDFMVQYFKPRLAAQCGGGG